MKTTIPKARLNRRQFLRRSAFSAAAFTIVPSYVLGLRGQTPPSEKLNLAAIGIGGQGAGDLEQLKSQNIVALCDVDKRYAAHTFKKFPDARQFTDYRQMLDEVKGIDGVVIATPDHHHAFASMEAIRRGKHVYCEKPLTHSVWEARHVTEAARAAKLATQMGNGGQASRETRRLCEYVWAGAIGDVREAHVWTDRPSNGLFKEYWPQGVARPNDTPPVPETLNWDLWVGPAPLRAYNPAYMPFKWRGWWDFGTGALGDMGCHLMDPIFRALKLSAPLTIQAASTRVNEETYPSGSMVTYEYGARSAEIQTTNCQPRGLSGAAAGGVAMPPCRVVWYDGGLRPARPEGLPDEKQMPTNGHLLIGDKGFILNNAVFPDAAANAVAHLPESIPPSPGHHREWVEACKGGPPAGSNFDFAGPLAEAVLAGNVALRVQLREELTLCKLDWDSAALKFTNVEDANKFVRREYRAGWNL